MAECAPTAESCFNGVDDDCDGLIDCADPDCVTIAVCVPPVTAPFVVGSTLDDPMSLCPAAYSKLEVIHSGPNDPGCTMLPPSMGGCDCSMVCHTQVRYFFSGCPNTDNENQLAVVQNTGCASWSTWNNTLDVEGLATPLSCTVSGTTTKIGATWAKSKEFCSTTQHGGGCSGGNWCVPATPGPSCEVAAGAQTCDPGYNAVTGPWYTDVDDTRSCQCQCGAPTGSCGTTVTLYSDNGCTSGATSFSAAGANNINCGVGGTFHSGKINVAPAACGTPIVHEAGGLAGTGQQTLCCVP
jgi:hypothetical protein